MDCQQREVILLRVRNLLEDRAMIRATADRQTLTGDGWLSDHAFGSWQKAIEIEALLQKLEAGHG